MPSEDAPARCIWLNFFLWLPGSETFTPLPRSHLGGAYRIQYANIFTADIAWAPAEILQGAKSNQSLSCTYFPFSSPRTRRSFCKGKLQLLPFISLSFPFPHPFFSVLPFPLPACSIVDSVCLFVRPSVCVCVELCRQTFQICTSTVSSDSHRTWHTRCMCRCKKTCITYVEILILNFSGDFFLNFNFRLSL